MVYKENGLFFIHENMLGKQRHLRKQRDAHFEISNQDVDEILINCNL